MKYPIVYIKSKGNHTSYFAELTDGQMCVVPNISSALQALMPLRANHAFILYEQQDPDSDCRDIRFLRAWFPACGIILITSAKLEDQERREYLRAGVNSALTGNVTREDFIRSLQFMANYSFTHKPVLQGDDVQIFHMPLWKRTFDVIASLSALILLSPLFAAVAAAIKLDSRGPVIYKSKRVGSNYRVFDFLKFRSMRTNADKKLKDLDAKNQYNSEQGAIEQGKITIEAADIDKLLSGMGEDMLFADDFFINEADHLQGMGIQQGNAFVKIENDPRVTPLGRTLRKYSIDELPQLINILRGDMSVVGNRPLPLYEAERLTSDEYIERFMCPSGLTGLWQVEKRGHAGKLSPEQRKQLDIRYAREMSPWLDLKIILRTCTAFIQKENV
ncbi:MAG: sugar transferase [Alistipes sp.]